MAVLDEPKGWISIVVGFILVTLGVIPILNMFNIISFTLPGFLQTIIAVIALYVIAGAGLYIIIDAFMEDDHARLISIIVGLIFLAIGIINVLGGFGIIPFTIPFLTLIVYQIIFVIEGIFLILAAFWMD